MSGYSGGMRRRLDLAATLMSRPSVLFLDEPTTGLDPRARAELWAVIDTLVDRGTTVVLTTQYLDEAERLADDIVVIDHGQVIARGDARTLKRTVGGDQVRVVVSDPDRLADAARIVGRRHRLRRRRSTPPPAPSPAPPAGAWRRWSWWPRACSGPASAVDDLSLRQPTLDEVFLTLTGSPAHDDHDDDEIETAEEAS